MSFNYTGVPNPPMPPILSGMGMPGPMMPGPQMAPQGFMGPIMTGQAPGPADPSQFSMPNMILPGMNDNPLEFNMNKNKPPMPIPIENTNNKDDSQKRESPSDRSRRRGEKRDRDRERREDKDKRDDREKDNNSGSNSSPQDNVPSQTPLAPNMWGGVVGMGYSVMGMNMIMDPNMMSMNNYGMMQPMMTDGAIMPQQDPAMIQQNPILPSTPIKEIIHCKSCTLFPPNPNAPPPTTRERPPGCRTVFVGGLPENITEDIIMEVFERCGEITTLRLSKKNFCHIRFVYEEYVDHAIFLSGYRIRIGSNTDAANNGRLHVDYAQARDDQYEWECRQRQLQREQRHRERMEEERMRPPSPPPVVHYTDHEASSVSEKIKQDESFSKAVQIVITWLERGDCNKRNSNTFYSMIQSTNSHVRRLLSEKGQYEEELQKAKEIMKGRMQGILIQFGQIERVFSAACHKKVWDHFTKAQRKNIEMWRKQSMEIKTIQLEDALNERADDEMDVSDEEEVSQLIRKRPRNTDSLEQERSNLKDENDSLRCQLEAYKNEVDLIRNDMKQELENKDKQLKILQQTLQGMQQQLIESRRKHAEEENKVRVLEQQKQSEKFKNLLDSEPTIIDLDGVDSVKSVDSPVPTELSKSESSDTNTPSSTHLSDRDAKLIGVISTFLHVHPFGAGVDYVWSYVHKLEPSLKPADVENLMSRFPAVFKQELSGIGANMERRWQFNGFNNVSSSDGKSC